MTDHDGLHAALAAVQADLPTIVKEHTAKIETTRGRDYEYSYASLNDVNRALLPLLAEHGLTWVCLPQSDGRMLGLLTHVSGESLESSWPLPNSSDPRSLGSAITYGRRYLLTAVVGSAPDEDDDGAAAQRDTPADVPHPKWLQQRASDWVGDDDERKQQVVEWLAERGVDKVAALDADGLVALDVQLEAWESAGE